ncbi:MAG TPA: hypothetical protein VM870_03330, partial [Pyrinomonadaceae bacterium]|nr:hypothetical protein [Pyrinomonadaceae bacterium]
AGHWFEPSSAHLNTGLPVSNRKPYIFTSTLYFRKQSHTAVNIGASNTLIECEYENTSLDFKKTRYLKSSFESIIKDMTMDRSAQGAWVFVRRAVRRGG